MGLRSWLTVIDNQNQWEQFKVSINDINKYFEDPIAYSIEITTPSSLFSKGDIVIAWDSDGKPGDMLKLFPKTILLDNYLPDNPDWNKNPERYGKFIDDVDKFFNEKGMENVLYAISKGFLSYKNDIKHLELIKVLKQDVIKDLYSLNDIKTFLSAIHKFKTGGTINNEQITASKNDFVKILDEHTEKINSHKHLKENGKHTEQDEIRAIKKVHTNPKFDQGLTM